MVAMEEKEQNKFLCMLLLLLCSLVCFSTAADFMSHNTTAASDAQLGWAVACGLISFVITLAFLGATKFLPELAEKFGPILSSFLVIWWAFGVGFLTGSSGVYTNGAECPASQRRSIFAETNNGYFAVWLAFISALYYLYLSVDQIQTSLEGKDYVNGLVTVAIASIIEFCAAADFGGSDAWAIACGLIGFAAAFIQMVLRSYAPEWSKKTAPVISIFLVVWWTFGVGFITGGGGPFFNTCCERANGFLSCWTAFLASIYYCFKTLLDYEQPPPVILDAGSNESQGFASVQPQGDSGYAVVDGNQV